MFLKKKKNNCLYSMKIFLFAGIVGDYKNYLSPEQNRRLEEKFREKTKGTDLPELWKDIM